MLSMLSKVWSVHRTNTNFHWHWWSKAWYWTVIWTQEHEDRTLDKHTVITKHLVYSEWCTA